jgi:hypothetical protein
VATNRRRDTGYTLHQHSINFNDRRFGGGSRMDPRLLIVGGVVIVLLVVAFLGISSCVRSCSASTDTQATTDSRVASGVSADMTSRLEAALDSGDDLTWIAANADRYPSERMLELAIDEPAAVGFVRAYPDASKSAQSYADTVTQGTYPQLTQFDSRWGNVDYGGLPLGVTGSGPTCLSIAYMGLTGSGDKTPADVAQVATDAGCASGDSGTTGTFFVDKASDLGLSSSSLSVDTTSLTGALKDGKVVICLVKSGSLTSETHYVLVTGLNENGTANVWDPSSTEVGSHEWSCDTIVSASEALYGIAKAS